MFQFHSTHYRLKDKPTFITYNQIILSYGSKIHCSWEVWLGLILTWFRSRPAWYLLKLWIYYQCHRLVAHWVAGLWGLVGRVALPVVRDCCHLRVLDYLRDVLEHPTANHTGKGSLSVINAYHPYMPYILQGSPLQSMCNGRRKSLN